MDESEILVELLRAYSPSGSESAGVDAFVSVAERLGYATRIDPVGNGIASIGTGAPEILFLGHIDTVPGELPVRLEADRIHGRGACDAKGPLAAALAAGAAGPGAGRWTVVAAVGEETDSRGARYLADHPGPRAVIAGEPNRWDGIAIGYKGMLHRVAYITAPRRHGSSPDLTATERAIDYLRRFEAAVGPRSATGFRNLTWKLLGLRPDPRADLDAVRIDLDLRLPPGVMSETIEARLPDLPEGGAWEPGSGIEAWETSRATAVVRALEHGIRCVGGVPTLWRKGGTSDVNLVAPRWGVPAAVYGPGDPHLDHTVEESVDRHELGRSVAVLRAARPRLAAELAEPGVHSS
ncbi:MAG: M20/M25/M40 family metallo-hydrolase [Thermoplasmata archaeon]